MRLWLRVHPVIARLAGFALAAAVAETLLVLYYLDSWLTLPVL
jgi:hypothetical protein